MNRTKMVLLCNAVLMKRRAWRTGRVAHGRHMRGKQTGHERHLLPRAHNWSRETRMIGGDMSTLSISDSLSFPQKSFPKKNAFAAFARVNFFHPATHPAKNTFESSTVCDEEDFTNADPVDPVGVRYIFMFLFFQQKLYHISQIRLDSQY